MHRIPFILMLITATVCICIPQTLVAQGYSLGPVQVQGSAGFSSELYGVSGIDSRRPWGSGRIFARLSAEGLGFRYGLDMNLSTEQSSIRQDLNQLGLNASYRWLTVTAGDIRPVLSQYSLNGQNVRGSFVEATPGKFVFSAGGGRTQRAIRPSEEYPLASPVFARWMYAAKMGYQSSNTDYLHVIGTYGRDAVSSLNTGLRNDLNLTPAENSTLSTEFGKRFFNNMLNLDGTVTWSSYNGNIRLGAGAPGFGGDTVSPFSDEGIGTFSDYAGRLNLRFSRPNYSFNTAYERIQPGFISMGLPYIRNDQEQIQFRPQLYLLDRRVRVGLDYSHARNNLSGQLLNTTYRNQAGINTQTRITERLSIGGNYRLLLNSMVPVNSSSADMRQTTHTISLTPSYNWKQGAISHNMQLSSNIQLFSMERTDIEQDFRNEFTNLSTSLNYSVALDSGLSLSSGATHVMSRSSQSDLDAWRTQASVSRNFFDRLITLGVNTSYTHNTTSFGADVDRPDMQTQQFSLNIQAGYRLPIGDYLRLNVRGLRNSATTGASFSELQATLQLNHRF